MANIVDAMLNALPVSALEPEPLGFLDDEDSSTDTVCLWEPPAGCRFDGRRVPYIDPARELNLLLQYQGMAYNEAQEQAQIVLQNLSNIVPPDHEVAYFDWEETEKPACLPLPVFATSLREHQILTAHMADFLGQASQVLAELPMFRAHDDWDHTLSLNALPDLPPADAMVEMLPVSIWDNEDDAPRDYTLEHARWREEILPVAQTLNETLGEPVWHVDQSDEDCIGIHRWLYLHWCCTWKPHAPFVQYLLRASGAANLQALKAALLDPASYVHPFRQTGRVRSLQNWSPPTITYLPQEKQKITAVMFLSKKARDEMARWVLTQKIGHHVLVIAPPDLLVDDGWLTHATRFCRSKAVHSLDNVLPAQLVQTICNQYQANEFCFVHDQYPKNRWALHESDMPAPAREMFKRLHARGVRCWYHDRNGHDGQRTQ